MFAVIHMLWNIHGILGEQSLFTLKKKRQRQIQIAFFHYLWWIFKENAARLLIVLYNERRDVAKLTGKDVQGREK